MEINVDKNEFENLSSHSQANYALVHSEEYLSDTSETTLPSSETDAMMALEEAEKEAKEEIELEEVIVKGEGEGVKEVAEDARSTSSEATLPSSEAEALMPNPEDIVEVRMELEIEDNVNRDKILRESTQSQSDRNVSSPLSSNGEPVASEEENGAISSQLSQGGSYPCLRCPRTFWSRPNLEAHARVHSGERPFDCAACGRTFAQACHLRNHEIAAHGRAGPPRAFACAACGRAFGRQSALAAHARAHAQRLPPVGPEESQASAIASTGAQQVALAPAVATVGAPPLVPSNTPPAVMAPAAASAAGNLAPDTRQRPSAPSTTRPAGPVTCDVCGKTLSHRCSLARHMRTHTAAPRPRPHRCPRCSAAFGTPLQLADHERRHHTGERPFACARCPRRFHSKAHLKYHERSHDGARPFRCDFCHKAFMSQFGLTRHRRVHTGDFRYKCDECPDAFVSRGQLLAHARNHAAPSSSPGAPARPFPCPLCTAAFVQRGLLTLHLRKHTGEQPFRCGRCQRGFPHRRLLVAHQAVCREEAPPTLQPPNLPTPPPSIQSLLPKPPLTIPPPDLSAPSPPSLQQPMVATAMPLVPALVPAPAPAAGVASVSPAASTPPLMSPDSPPRLLLVTVKTPEGRQQGGGDADNDPMAPTAAVIVKVEQHSADVARRVTFKVEPGELNIENTTRAITEGNMENVTLDDADSVDQLPGAVIVKMEGATMNGEVDNLADVPEEAWRELNALARAQRETDPGPMPPGAVIVKIAQRDATGSSAAAAAAGAAAAGVVGAGAGDVEAVVVDTDDADARALAGMPLLVERGDGGTPWSVPTAVVTVRIDASDEDEDEDCWQDSAEDIEEGKGFDPSAQG